MIILIIILLFVLYTKRSQKKAEKKVYEKVVPQEERPKKTEDKRRDYFDAKLEDLLRERFDNFVSFSYQTTSANVIPYRNAYVNVTVELSDGIKKGVCIQTTKVWGKRDDPKEQVVTLTPERKWIEEHTIAIDNLTQKAIEDGQPEAEYDLPDDDDLKESIIKILGKNYDCFERNGKIVFNNSEILRTLAFGEV